MPYHEEDLPSCRKAVRVLLPVLYSVTNISGQVVASCSTAAEASQAPVIPQRFAERVQNGPSTRL